jgi:hypothetical protein
MKPTTRNCDQCQSPLPRDAHRHKRYCSPECRKPGRKPAWNKGKTSGLTKKCESCGKVVAIEPWQVNRTRFCSPACRSSWIAKRTLNKGPKPWAAANLEGHRQKSMTQFTAGTMSGNRHPRWTEGIEFSCERCGSTFRLKPSTIRTRRNQGGRIRFCSRECFRLSGAFCGEKSDCWVGGPKTYRGRGWKAARLLAVKRDEGNCQDCGNHFGNSIPVHHKRPFREFSTAEEANCLDNLVCLCQPCHMKREPRPTTRLPKPG